MSCPECGHEWEEANHRSSAERIRDRFGDIGGRTFIGGMWLALAGVVGLLLFMLGATFVWPFIGGSEGALFGLFILFACCGWKLMLRPMSLRRSLRLREQLEEQGISDAIQGDHLPQRRSKDRSL